jgi:hypothetical protein
MGRSSHFKVVLRKVRVPIRHSGYTMRSPDRLSEHVLQEIFLRPLVCHITGSMLSYVFGTATDVPKFSWTALNWTRKPSFWFCSVTF